MAWSCTGCHEGVQEGRHREPSGERLLAGFKTQLIRCAPRHVRADVKSLGHALDDTQSALNTVRKLRSRGVTRHYDLNQANRQNLADVEDDEHGEADALESASDHEMAPPRQ